MYWYLFPSLFIPKTQVDMGFWNNCFLYDLFNIFCKFFIKFELKINIFEILAVVNFCDVWQEFMLLILKMFVTMYC